MCYNNQFYGIIINKNLDFSIKHMNENIHILENKLYGTVLRVNEVFP